MDARIGVSEADVVAARQARAAVAHDGNAALFHPRHLAAASSGDRGRFVGGRVVRDDDLHGTFVATAGGIDAVEQPRQQARFVIGGDDERVPHHASGLRKNTTRSVSSNPNARCTAWLSWFSSAASEASSQQPLARAQPHTAATSDAATPWRRDSGST